MTDKNLLIAIILIVEDHPPTLAVVRQLVSAALPACRAMAALPRA